MQNSMEVPMELNTPSKNRIKTTIDSGTLTVTPTPTTAVTGSPSISHLENSPFLNYLNDLSPIMPVRYTSITHCASNFQTLNTIFSSPQPNPHVITRSFIGRNQSLDQGEGSAKAVDTMKAPQQHSGSQDDTELSPDSNRSGDIWRGFDVEMEEKKSDKGFVLSKRKERLDESDYNWDDLTFEFDSPLVFRLCEEEKSIDQGISSFISEVLQTPENHAEGSVIKEFTGAAYSPIGKNMGEFGSQSNTFEGQMNVDQMPDILSGSLLELVGGETTVEVDASQEISGHPQSKQNSLRRRCLRYEMPGVHKGKAQCNSISSSPMVIGSADKVIDVETYALESNNLSKISEKGVGLHLNAIATTLNNGEAVKIKNFSSEKKETNLVCCGSNNKVIQIAPQQLTVAGRDSDETCPGAKRQKLEVIRCGSNNKVIQIPPQQLTDVGEDSGITSPTAKRQKLEPGTSCKRCNCKRSKCLKLYCECFAAGMYCIEPCSCQDCFNKPAHEDVVVETRRQIESRCPLAFAPKVINTADTESGDETSKTPASARHKKGCNCKRSSCLKKYCECFQGGVGCSSFCRCEACKNTFGRRRGVEVNELEAEELNVDKKTESDATLNNDVTEKREQQPTFLTPFENPRFPIQPNITSTGQPSGSSHPADTPYQIHAILQRQPLRERVNHTTIPENEASDATIIKCSTAKRKENVTSLHSTGISSHLAPGKLSRRLILRSLPPFPSLNVQGDTHQ